MTDSSLSRVLNIDSNCIEEQVPLFSGTSFKDVAGSTSVEKDCYIPSKEEKEDSQKTISTFAQLKNYFLKIDEFRGYIKDVFERNNEFLALLYGDDGLEREVLFSYDDVQKEYWNQIAAFQEIIYIYCKQYEHGTEYNSSRIYFRKNKKWTPQEIAQRQKESEELFNILNDDK